MKKLVQNNFIRKTILALCIILVMTFTLPQRAYADVWSDIGGTLLKEIVKLIASIGDIGMAALNHFMLGTDNFTSAMISKDDANLQPDSGSWLTEGVDVSNPNAPVKKFNLDDIDITFLGIGVGDSYQVPNMLFSPENIFANNIAALDVNFLHPNQYTSAIEGANANSAEGTVEGDAYAASQSAASDLREVISSWYRSFRNIAIVGLLSVLIYLGIRIIISSTADDKARYKESIKNWVVALCLVFIIHFIMSAILMITDRVTELFATNVNSGFIVQVGDDQAFRTNLTGLIRFQAQRKDAMEATAYTIMYMVLVVYTFRFTFIYFKRFLYTAFFTMIAPLVALTYPIDKAGDGKAQAFNMWFKEYTMNVIIQPVHLILYTVFVGSAMDLVSKNPIYAIVAIGFLIPAEKFIKKMFGLDRAESTGDFGAFAGGAVAMKALQTVTGRIGKGGKSSGGSSTSDKDDGEQGKIFTVKRTIGNGTGRNLDTDSGQSGDSSTVRSEDTQEQKEEERRRQEALQTYMNQGGMYGQNENGDYYNPYIDDYDPNYDPSTDSANGYESVEQASLPQDTGHQETLDQGSDNSEDTQADPNLRNLANKGKPEKLPGSRRKLAWKATKSMGRHLYKGAKIAAVGVGGAVGAGVGASIGIATGKPSNAFQYAATGAGIGAVAGRGISLASETGVNVGKDIVGNVQEKLDGIADTYNETTYGRDYARQQQIERINDRARREFLKDEKQQSKYEEMARDVGYTGDLDNFMNAAFDMRVAGIKDEKLQKNALKLEMKRDNGQVGGKSHEGVMDVAAFANDNGYDRKYIEDAKKRESMEGVVQSMVSGEDNQMAIMETFAGLYGREDYYRQHSGIRQAKGRKNTTTQGSTSANNGTPTRRRGRPPRNT